MTRLSSIAAMATAMTGALPPGARRRLTPPMLSGAVCMVFLAVYFFGFVYPAAVANERIRAAVVAIPQLAAHVAAAERRRREAVQAATAARLGALSLVRELRADVPLREVHRDLNRLARDCRMRVVDMDAAAAWDAATAPFAHARATWRLRGGYPGYLAFKRALAAYRPVIVHVAGERLARADGGGLAVDLTLSFYRYDGAEDS